MDKKFILSNCSQCGSLFVKSQGNSLCNRCKGIIKNSRRLINNYLERNSFININEISLLTNLNTAIVSNIVKENVYWGDSNTRIKCRICGKSIKLTSRRLICLDCMTEFSKNSGNLSKISKIRDDLRTKNRLQKEYDKKNPQKTTVVPKNKYGFKNPFKEHFERNSGNKEVEIIPEVLVSCSLKLSSNRNPVLVYA